MSFSVLVNGTTYIFPSPGDNYAWALGPNSNGINAWAQAISGQTYQPNTGASLPLTATLDFGANFGIKALTFQTKTANPAATGVVRLANSDGIVFRNAANSGDLTLQPHADGFLQYNGVDLVMASLSQTLTNKTLTSPTLNSPTITSSPSVAPTVLYFGADSSLANTTTAFAFPGCGGAAVSATERWVMMPCAGKLSNLYVREATGSTTQGVVYTVRQNGSNTTITCTCAAGAGVVTANDTTHTVTVAAGDVISISVIGVSGITAGCGELSAAIQFTQA